MDYETIEQKVKKRANERAATKINAFKQAVSDALKELIGTNLALGAYSTALRDTPGLSDEGRVARGCLLVLLSDNNTKGWPKGIWEREAQIVRDEVFATMNEMQKMLAAREKSSDDPQPAESDDDDDDLI